MVNKLVEWTTVKGFTLDGLKAFLEDNAEMLAGKSLDLTYSKVQEDIITSAPTVIDEQGEEQPRPEYEEYLAMTVPGTDIKLPEYKREHLWDDLVAPILGLNNKTIECKVGQHYYDFMIELAGHLCVSFFGNETNGFRQTDAEIKKEFADYIRKYSIHLPEDMDGEYMVALTDPVFSRAKDLFEDLKQLKQYENREVDCHAKQPLKIKNLYEEEGVAGLGIALMNNRQPEIANDLKKYTAIILKYPELITPGGFHAAFAPFLGYDETLLEKMNTDPDFYRVKVEEIRERMLKSIK